MVTSKATKQ